MLSEIFDTASINNIAIIDDDLSLKVSLDNMRSKDENIVNALADPDDPDREELDKLLEESGVKNETIEDLVDALAINDIRNKAPERLKNFVKSILDERCGQAKPVHQLCEWLSDEGIDTTLFDVFTSPAEVDLEKTYDLIIVDYFLVDNSKEETIPLIKRLLETHKDQPNPLLIILMSSHEPELRADFSSLRPKLGITSSRFRIMKKPMEQSIDEHIQWLLTLQQLALERSVILPVESFLKQWGDKIKSASDKLAKGLWELDAHSLEILHQAAEDDHAHFEDYLAQILSRRILAEVEESGFPVEETKNLSEKLFAIKEALSSGTEIGDSRKALRELLGDIGWKRENFWDTADLPENDEDKFDWIKKHIRFGCILKSENEQLFVHVTQSCDIAHVTYQERMKQHLLFFPGELVKTDRRSNGGKEHSSEAYFYEGDWHNIHWQLTRPQTISFDLLIQDLEKYTVVGQLREDQTQGIINNYAARSARVAGIRIPQFSPLSGFIVTIKKDDDGTYSLLKNEDFEFKSHLYCFKNNNKEIERINFELESAISIGNYIEIEDWDKKSVVSELMQGCKNNESLCDGKLKFVIVPTGINDPDEAMEWANKQPSYQDNALKKPFNKGVKLAFLWRC